MESRRSGLTGGLDTRRNGHAADRLPISLTQEILGQQKIDERISYRSTVYCMWIEQPEVRLGRCESHIDKGICGSVFSGERDEEVRQKGRKRHSAEADSV